MPFAIWEKPSSDRGNLSREAISSIHQESPWERMAVLLEPQPWSLDSGVRPPSVTNQNASRQMSHRCPLQQNVLPAPSLLALNTPQSCNKQSTGKVWGSMPSQCDAARAWAQRTSQVLLLCSRMAAGRAFRGLNLPKPKQRWTYKDPQHSEEPEVFLP